MLPADALAAQQRADTKTLQAVTVVTWLVYEYTFLECYQSMCLAQVRWCSWLSRSPHTREVTSSILV